MPVPPRPDWRLAGASVPRALRFLAADYPTAVRLRRFRGGSRPPDWSDGDLAPVLLLPGVYEPWWYLRPLGSLLHRAGHPVLALPELGRNLRPIEDSARIAAAALEGRDLRGVVLVAHSKGGLIGKTLMTRFDPDARVARLVAVATPWRGSGVAAFAPGRALREFRTSDPLVLALDAEREVNSRITSVYPIFDPHIPEGSWLVGARNVVLRRGGHFGLLEAPDALSVVIGAVEESSPPPSVSG